MKLIYLANARIPTEKAHGIQIMQMLKAFANSKLNPPADGQNSKPKIELIIPRRYNKIKVDSFEYYGVERIFKIKKLPCMDLIPLGLPKIGFLVQTFTFLVSAKIYLLFKKYDFFYTREQLAGLFFQNFILELHYLPKKITFWHRKSWQSAQKIITINNFIKDKIIENGVEGDKILVAPDGVDLEKFQIKESQVECRKKLNLPLDKKIVLYAGHLYQWKGGDVLAQATRFLPVDVETYFVGGTIEDVKKFKIQNSKSKIQVIGHRPYAEIPYWLAAADVLVLPNSASEKISSHYTSPLKLFEYMASGRPIVASNLPSLGEILNQNNAILVKPDDPDSLAQGIILALQKSENLAKVAAQARLEANGFSWQKRAENIINFIKFST